MANRLAACYLRVSTTEQAERQTIEGQRDFLRQYCALYDVMIAQEYADPGVSGGLALVKRPGGKALLEAARAGVFTEVLVWKVDRLGRSSKVLGDAFEDLDSLGIAIKSATEPFDTGQATGRFVFQLLASFAELERANISERTTMGRDRVTRAGVWTAGWLPWGYVKADDGQLAPSTQIVEPLGIPVSAAVLELYTNVASGSTAAAEARRLNALGVIPVATTALGTPRQRSSLWTVSRVASIIRNPVYRGELTLRSRRGTVTADSPALVPPALWYAAVTQLRSNRQWASRRARQPYLLRRLMVCAHCGSAYIGGGWGEKRFYVCGGSKRVHLPPADRCHGRMLAADQVEAEVWAGVKEWMLREDYLQEAAEPVAPNDDDARRLTLTAALAAKEADVQKILTLLRSNHLTTAQAAPQLDAIARETRTLRDLLAALDAQTALSDAEFARRAELPQHIAALRLELPILEADPAYRARVITTLVRRVVVTTAPDDRGRLRAAAAVEMV